MTEYLNGKKDELLEQKKMAEMKNEEIRKTMAGQEDVAAKRI